ncbi:hypothetical protein [Viridibacterium curvum]|uniref:DUF3617 family protein n=1 Tax=Viridibacterium curvum TaxID=1101404 RepID=A0ABP9R4G1_9RHOO
MKTSLTAALALFVIATAKPGTAAHPSPVGIAAAPAFASNIETQPDINGCNWHAKFVRTLVAETNGLVLEMSDDEMAKAPRKVKVTVTRLFAPRLGGQKRRLAYKLEFMQDGKLVALRQIEDRTLRDNEPVCGLMGALATNLAKDTAEWLTLNRLPDCGPQCTGLHPREPIAIGAQPLFPSGDFVKSLGKCDWLTSVMPDLSETLNDESEDRMKDKEPTGAGLLPITTKIAQEDIVDYKGRRLVLRFDKLNLKPANPQDNASTDLTAELHDGPMLVAARRFSNDTSFHGSTLCKTMARLGDRAMGDVVKWLMKDPGLPANWQQ